MKKPSIKWLALTAVAGISLCISGVHMANASEVLYDDSNVSLTSAVDRYIATNDNPVANIVEGYQEETTEKSETLVAGIDDEAGTVNDNKPTATIEEVKQPEKATGSVKVNNITGEISKVDGSTEATTEEQAESTTEATTTETSYDNTSTDGFTYALAEPDFTGRAVVKATGTVNIRQSGDISASRVGDIAGGGIVKVEEKGSEWTKISSNGITGYMKNDYLLFDSDAASYAAGNLKKVVRINTASLRVRAAANENSETLSIVTEGSPYGIEEIGAGWTKISVDDSTSGYVRNDYIILDYTGPVAHVVTDPVVTPPSTSESTTESAGSTESSGITTPPSSNLGQEIANYAQQFVGNPYVYGGTSLTNGADCSGFVMTIYKNYGYSIPRTADVQGTVGTEVALSAVAPGDLIFYDRGTGSIKHVAMYIGNGQVVHASSSTTGIIISNMYYSTPCKAVRIVN